MIPISYTRATDVVRGETPLLDKLLKAGQRAPYVGVLVPGYHYKILSSCLQELPICESGLQEYISTGMSFGDFALLFGAGAVFGVAMYAVIKH